tara:strand:- start:258 stop:848 length:591 start_codon:yes stop_codon:yes gene_type:complete
MSTLKLTGSSSGSTSLTAPASGSDRTITFPDAAGTVALKSGSIIQVDHTSWTTEATSTNSATFADVSGMTASIDNVASGSKLLLMLRIQYKVSRSDDNARCGFRIVRTSGTPATLYDPQAASSGPTELGIYVGAGSGCWSNGVWCPHIYDSSPGTGTVSYKVQFATATATSTHVVVVNDADTVNGTSSCTILEIGG